MAPYQGLIFDFNGVLWWDGHLQEQAWHQFSAQVRGVSFSAEETAVYVHGRNNTDTQTYLARRSLSAQESARLGEEKEIIYRRLCLDQGPDFKLSPGAIDLLDLLEDHRIPHTIATASGKRNLDFFVEHLDLDRWFDIAKIVYDDGSRPGKPAPDIYLQAARGLGLAPGTCVVVEDSRSGVEAARAAGIGHIIALGPTSGHAELTQLPGVGQVISSLDQIDGQNLFLKDQRR